VTGSPLELYAASFLARHIRDPAGGRAVLDGPGLWGVGPAGDEQTIRLLVADDRAYDRVAAEVPAARHGSVSVFEAATRCDALLRARAGWQANRPSTGMVCRDVVSVPDALLPDGLALRAVSRVASDPAHGVPLDAAAAVAVASDPGLTEPLEVFGAFLRSLPPSVRLLAAVDEGGVPRATSGYDAFGEEARVFFVNTAPGWRGRGIARAMTAAALRAAARSGARRAALDATDVAVSLYRRLGFEVAGRLTRYVPAT
jgi:ribosomal protein S18 acetylase RimI-like enzyme